MGKRQRPRGPDFLAQLGLSGENTELVANWLAEELENDRFARLEQAGDSVEGKIPLSRVFVDLEVVDETRRTSRRFVRLVLGLKSQAFGRIEDPEIEEHADLGE